MTTTILIVDDDPIQRRLLETMVQRLGYRPVLASGGEDGLARLTGPGGVDIDLTVLDLVMPDLDGMGVLGRLRAAGDGRPVVVQTGPNSVEAVISAIRAGAQDFVVKPVGVERLAVTIRNALKAAALESDIRRASRHQSGALTLADLASRSPDMARALRLAERCCKTTMPVLIEGEAGVGKEYLARAIQGSSDRRNKPFVTASCAAIPEADIEAVLFGTGAAAAGDRHAGKFAEAQGGTLFIDDIGALTASAQARLMRAVAEGEVEHEPGRRLLKIEARLIVATRASLLERVKAGLFREDLYYRLNVFPITMPPLRARREDLEPLARRFCARFAAEEGKRIRGLSAEAGAMLAAYDWPGNVRQLENAVFRAVALCDGDELRVTDFPQLAARLGGFDARPPALPAMRLFEPDRLRETKREPTLDNPTTLRLLGDDGHVRPLAAIEEQAIRFALDHYRSHMTVLARRLGIGRSTLYRKLKDLGLLDGEGATDKAA